MQRESCAHNGHLQSPSLLEQAERRGMAVAARCVTVPCSRLASSRAFVDSRGRGAERDKGKLRPLI